MNIRIITDSAADFTQQELAAHHIHCVPMTITLGEEAFIDGVTLSPDTFWQRLLAGETAKTSQPSPDAFLSAFEDARAARGRRGLRASLFRAFRHAAKRDDRPVHDRL